MRSLFDETTIRGMQLKNRIVRSATWEGMCDKDGRPAKKLIDWYDTLASGEVGLIISGYAYVRPDGKQLPGKMGIYSDALMPDLQKLVNVVHDADGKICVQLVHAGGQTDTVMAGRKPLAPSAVQVEQFSEVPDELTVNDIKEIISCFADAARRAKKCGFDAVQLHGAHGYLINQFLSPLTNRRHDDYGGAIANRCRFLMEVYQAVRQAVGNEFPVMIKLNGADNLSGGLSLDDAVQAAKLLDKAGIDAIEVSGGTPASPDGQTPVRKNILTPDAEAYNLPLAKAIKAYVSCPVMAVGGFRSYAVADQAITKQNMDYIAMSRPLIREPDLPKRWRNGDRTPATCISCNSCFGPGLEEGGIYCVVEAKERGKAK